MRETQLKSSRALLKLQRDVNHGLGEALLLVKIGANRQETRMAGKDTQLSQRVIMATSLRWGMNRGRRNKRKHVFSEKARKIMT